MSSTKFKFAEQADALNMLCRTGMQLECERWSFINSITSNSLFAYRHADIWSAQHINDCAIVFHVSNIFIWDLHDRCCRWYMHWLLLSTNYCFERNSFHIVLFYLRLVLCDCKILKLVTTQTHNWYGVLCTRFLNICFENLVQTKPNK